MTLLLLPRAHHDRRREKAHCASHRLLSETKLEAGFNFVRGARHRPAARPDNLKERHL